jgi:cytochrome c-type biogenesis protein
VLGFAAMFVAFGAGAAWFGSVLLENRRTLELAAGIFIALAGLVYAGVPLPRLLLAERRLHPPSGRGGVVTPTLAGIAFAVGWTPCLGPTLAAILALAAGEGHPGQGAVLLAVYALGLGIPFLLFGLLFTRSLGLVRALRRNWRLVSLASGSLLVAFGVLLATGELVRLTTRLARFTGISI